MKSKILDISLSNCIHELYYRNFFIVSKIDENRCKQTRASLPYFGRAGSISLQLYLTYNRLLHVRVAVNSHALPVHKKNRITSLLCIFETIIHVSVYCVKNNASIRLYQPNFKMHDVHVLR